MTGPPTPLSGHVLAVSVGGAGTLADGRRAIRSGFAKAPVEGPVPLGVLGLPGDAHVYRHHGGPDMALCVYPAEHLDPWRATGLDLPDLAAFGENLTTRGLVETDVRIGDVFAVVDAAGGGGGSSAGGCGGGGLGVAGLGSAGGGAGGRRTALVQVTQSRSPCRKIAVRHGRPRLDLALARAGHVGWLLRVLEPGTVAAGQSLELVERHDAAVTVAEASRVLDLDRADLPAARALLASPGLADAVAATLRRRLDTAASG